MTAADIEAVEAHATSLLEWAKKQRAKLEKKPTRRSALTPAQIALLDSQREKTLNRRKSQI